MAKQTTASTFALRKRCKYCGSSLVEKYGLMWCGKPCRLGALDLKIYEEENHLGPYAPPEPEPETESGK